jgi:tRNA nucleotidyltransferase/poly(A) polymerase
MRDMMGGLPIRDLDFTVEGSTVKFAKSIAQNVKAEVLSVDDARKSVELRFPENVAVSISSAHQERYPRPGAKPQIQPSTIHEDLRCRDFTVNAIALSLGKASRGLLLDPTNGLGDLRNRELRAISSHTLFDDPSRIFRLIRLKIRLGFAVDERTQLQYRNALEADLPAKISPEALHREFMQIAQEPLAGEILQALDEEKLLGVISPALTGAKLNLAGFQKLQKLQSALGPESALARDAGRLFFYLLFEKLTPRERGQVARALGLDKTTMEAVGKLDAKAAKLEKELTAFKVSRPSSLYWLLSKVPGELILFLLMRSKQRIVLDRLKNYYQKYLPAAHEVTEADILEQGAELGTPKFAKARVELITARLDARPKKIAVEEPTSPPPVAPGRRSQSILNR